MDDRPQYFYWGISGTVCTVEYSTVDSTVNAKLFILVRPMSAFVGIRVLRREFLGDSKSNAYFEDHVARIFNIVSSIIVMKNQGLQEIV